MHLLKTKYDTPLFALLLAGIAVCFLGVTLFVHKPLFTTRFDPVQAERTYSKSQWSESQNVAPDQVLNDWALKHGYTGWQNYQDETPSQSAIQHQKEKIMQDIQNQGVSDSFLYTYVGYKYVTGTSPQLLNPEHPPLAKYLIGASILLFHNEHVMSALFALFTLIVVGALVYTLSSSYLQSGLAVLLTATFSLFIDQITHGPQLELYQLFFFLCMYFFWELYQRKKHIFFLLITGVMYGAMLATKTVLPFLALTSVWLLVIGRKQIQQVVLVWGVGIITFCATYFVFFLQGGTLRSFLGLQKYIMLFYRDANIPLVEFAGNYLRLIFTGHWKFWDAARTVSAYSEWNITWPILFVAGVWAMIRKWKQFFSLVIFIILYNGFLFVTPMFPRYLVLLYVPLFILMTA